MGEGEGDAVVQPLSAFPIHLGLGAMASFQERFDGTPDWYQRYGERHAADGADGWLVSQHTFSEPWGTWEMHPEGHEVVSCVSGQLTLHQELASGEERTVVLGPGDTTINPPGVWHTADVAGEATVFFITAGRGTQIRPR